LRADADVELEGVIADLLLGEGDLALAARFEARRNGLRTADE
jgi:hypothetical protein